MPDGDSLHVAWYALVRELSYDKLEKLKDLFQNKSDNADEEGYINKDEFEKNIFELFGKFTK